MADKIAKKLPKRCSRGPGAWIALARGRDNNARSLLVRDPRRGISYPRIGDVGSAAYRRLLAGRGRR